MISIYDIKSWSDVATFLIWTLAVCAIAKAIFGSLLSAEVHYRFALRDAPRRQRMNRLNWQISNRARWDEGVAQRSPHAAKQPLSDEETESLRHELQHLVRTSFARRALTYFMSCLACQTFWTAVAIFVCTRGVVSFSALLLTAAAHSGAVIMLARLVSPPNPAIDRAAAKGPCRSCGK